MNIARIVLVDDHQIMRDGLRLLLTGQPGWEIVGSAFNGDAAWKIIVQAQPDLVIMDLDLPGEDGVSLTTRILGAYPKIKILVLTATAEPQIVRAALSAGASGYLLKSNASELLRAAIREVLAGQIYLSPEISTVVVHEFQREIGRSAGRTALSTREIEVLKAIADGQSTKEIAFALEVSVKTVETHRANLMTKLGVASVAGLTKYAVREGITTL